MTSDEVFDSGYCIPQYDINDNKLCLRFRGESFVIKRGSVPMKPDDKWWQLAKIEDVRKLQEENARKA